MDRQYDEFQALLAKMHRQRRAEAITMAVAIFVAGLVAGFGIILIVTGAF